MINYTINLPERIQGTIEVLPGIQTKVMGIHTFGQHWCGYVEWPMNRIPTPVERQEIIRRSDIFVTFLGPSGDKIQWMAPGFGENGAGYEPDPPNMNLYWIGFDLPASFDKESFIPYLAEFAREVMEAFRLD